MTLEGFEPLQAALRRLPELVASMSADAVQRSSFAIAQHAKARVPVRSGALKRNITATTRVSTSRTRGLTGAVGLSAEPGSGSRGKPPTVYWRFVEFGTVHHPAQPFFRPAADEESSVFVQRIRAIGQQLERDFSSGRFL